MKKIWILTAAVLLLCALCGCKEQPVQPTPTIPTDTISEDQFQRPPAKGGSLVGTWENSGKYDDGKEFVETVIIRTDGTAEIRLVYQGADYQTISGTFDVADGFLTVHVTSEDSPYDEVYQYEVNGDELRLTGEAKDAIYTKIG